MNTPQPSELREKLASECGEIPWKDLEPHRARGVLIEVDASLKLTDAAYAIVKDIKEDVSTWIEKGKLSQLSDTRHEYFQNNQPPCRAIITSPYVLFQEIM